MANVTTYSAFTDAQSQNDISRNVRQYRDLDLFFARKQGSDDVNIITDIEAVKRSIRNLVLLNYYEKPFNPDIGSNVRDILFENMSPLTSVVLARAVEEVIENFEPRARLISVRAFPDLDRNEYELTIEFFVVNTPTELVDMTVFLEVLR